MDNELRFSKLCWNYNGWRKPSGLVGKSPDNKSYERKHKFGHEEWLFDFDKLIDGFHYASLQPIGKFRDKYIGNTFNIRLYSVNSKDKQWYWIATIWNVEAIDRNLEADAIRAYRKKGWLDEMADDLVAIGAKEKKFLASIQEYGLFNVRFKPEDVVWFGAEPLPFDSHEKITHTRYTLLTKDSVVSDKRLLPITNTKPELNFGSTTVKSKHNGIRLPNQQTVIQCLQLHTDIQNSLIEYLKINNPGYKKIGLEVGKKGDGGTIDLVMRRPNGQDVFYEVKTYASAKMCIREAVGQLMEYAYYPSCALSSELVIVSQAPLDENSKQYIKLLNTKFSIPVSYMQFDHVKKLPIEFIGNK